MAKNPKTRNLGEWTEARFFSFVKGALRQASWRWGPAQECLRRARVGRGLYRCDCCGEIGPPSLPPKEGGKRRIKNIIADHIDPIIDPDVGFVSWDVLIERMFVELDGYQALCSACHNKKTKEETERGRERRKQQQVERVQSVQ